MKGRKNRIEELKIIKKYCKSHNEINLDSVNEELNKLTSRVSRQEMIRQVALAGKKALDDIEPLQSEIKDHYEVLNHFEWFCLHENDPEVINFMNQYIYKHRMEKEFKKPFDDLEK